MSIPWYYFWSEPFFNATMTHAIKGYDMKPILFYFNRLEQKSGSIVSALKTSTSPFIIVSDSDLIVKPSIENVVSTMTYDMIFMNGPDNKPQSGFMQLRVCSDVIEFWESVVTLEESLPDFKGTWSTFSNTIITSDIWDKTSDFSILQIIPSDLGKEFDFAEKIFTMAQHIDLQEYMKLVPEEVIPFIYKIQELLFLSYQEMQK